MQANKNPAGGPGSVLGLEEIVCADSSLPVAGQAVKLKEQALKYAAGGWRVFPCKISKGPLVNDWPNAASTAPETIRAWWAKWPGASIGCPAGALRGAWVLDVDLPDGPGSLAALQAEHGPLPATLEQRTGGGGRQLFFQWSEAREVRNSVNKLAPGLDVRGEGGYVILPPSGHPSGGAYAWTSNGAPLAEAPGWLLDMVAPLPTVAQAAKPASLPARMHGTTPYGRKALEAEAANVVGTLPGGRNQALNESAFALGQLVAGGELDRQEAESALIGAALAAGLPEQEARKTIASGLPAGEKEPRSAPKQQAGGVNPEPPQGKPTTGGLALICAADVEPEPVNWIWPGHVSAGVVHVVDGVPGVGKSMFSCYLAGVITTGTAWPDGTRAEIGNVIMVNLEDDLARTLRPRLGEAGADLGRVFMFDDAGDGFTLPADLDRLESAIVKHTAKLAIIDPLMAVLDGKVNSYRDQDVRRVLAALKALCGRTGCAVVLVRHLTKASGGPAIHRGGGSIGIIGAARVGLLLATDPKDDSRRILATVKNNLGPFDPKKSTSWTIAPGPRLEYAGTMDMSADDLLIEQDEKRGRGRPEEKQSGAEDWLRKKLAEGPMPSTVLMEQAKAAGYSEKTTKRARKEVAETFKVGETWHVKIAHEEQGGQNSIYNDFWPSSPCEHDNRLNCKDNEEGQNSQEIKGAKIPEWQPGQSEAVI